MKHLLKITLGYLIGVSFFIACNNQSSTTQNNNEKSNNTKKKGNFTNPNKDSELTLVMRDIFDKTERIKKSLANNEQLPTWYSNYIDELKKIHTATSTDTTIKESTFYAFIDLLNRNAIELKQNTNKENYNQLVNSCIKCHQSYCPGPIVKIKKLYLN
jgi:lipopolysaccharide export LptBFGC system permease protein LptF